MNYPTNCNKPSERLAFALRYKERVRLIHNVFSDWLFRGLTEQQWNTLPLNLKKKYPFASHISKDDRDRFKKEDFESMQDEAINEVMKYKKIAADDTKWDNDIVVDIK